MLISSLKHRFQRSRQAKGHYAFMGVDETKLLQRLKEENAARKGYNKVFCIGYNKTGTSTLEAVLRDLGFRLPPQQLQETLTSHVLVSGNYGELKRLVAKYDAFQDMPFAQEHMYVALDTLFPNSKFILSLRDPQKWFDSLVGFHKKAFGVTSVRELTADFWKEAGYLHKNYSFEQQRRLVTTVEDQRVVERWDLQYHRETRIQEFVSRNDDIIRYFRNRPSDLLCLDLSKEKTLHGFASFSG